MVFNAIFNNISVISWRSVLLVEETEVWPNKTFISYCTLSHDILSCSVLMDGPLSPIEPLFPVEPLLPEIYLALY
jgi:hypothetical protein